MREDAEALVDTLVNAASSRRYCEDGVPYDVDAARAKLLRACVVDAAEVAALRAQRDALKVELAAEKKRIAHVAGQRHRNDALNRTNTRLRQERDEARVQRDEAVAEVAAVKNPAPFPSDRFVASMLSLLPEYFNDADLHVAWDAMSKALKHAAEDIPRDTPEIERATGVPEAAQNIPTVHLIKAASTAAGTPERLLETMRGSVSLIRVDGELFGLCVGLQRSTPATLPVADDAEALGERATGVPEAPEYVFTCDCDDGHPAACLSRPVEGGDCECDCHDPALHHTRVIRVGRKAAPRFHPDNGCTRDADTSAAPPVSDDADALLDAFGETYLWQRMSGGPSYREKCAAARAAVRARMRPLPTAEALWASWPTYSPAGRPRIEDLWVAIQNAEANAALQGGGK